MNAILHRRNWESGIIRNISRVIFCRKMETVNLGDCKPDSCKKYPYTDQPERLCSLLGMLDTISICPVVFEIFERLKKEYGFKRS